MIAYENLKCYLKTFGDKGEKLFPESEYSGMKIMENLNNERIAQITMVCMSVCVCVCVCGCLCVCVWVYARVFV